MDPNKLNTEQQKKIQAGVIQQMVKIIFKTHFYEWEGRIYRQIRGGPIGLRATGFIARVLMDHWAQELRRMEEQCKLLATINPVMFGNVTIHLLHNYVYDCFLAMNRLRIGIRWDHQNKAMIWTPESEAEDREAGIDPEILTIREISKMAGTVEKCLRLTYDTPRLNKTKTMPVLDTQIWIC